MAQQCISDLQAIGDEIQNVIRNFKKDPETRKINIEYFNERSRRLKNLWNDFEAKNTELMSMEDLPRDHDIFQSDYFDNLKNLVQQYLNTFQTQIMILGRGDAATNGLAKATIKQAEGLAVPAVKDANPTQDDAISPNKNGLVRKLDVKMAALQRLLFGISLDTQIQSRQYFNVKKESVQQAWQQIEALYEVIWEQYNDPTSIGADFEKYLKLESEAQNTIIELSIRLEQPRNDINSSSLPLPKLTIPKFDGDYAKWIQFFDLFSHMVDKQAIPNVQKMYYLKSNLSGEAERLVSHLAVTEENYKSAWTLLQERYNNQRILAATLCDKILDTPSCAGTAASIKALHDTVQECLLALDNLGVETKAWDVMLLQLLIKKLDSNTFMRYEQSILRPREIQSAKEFLSFLELHFHSMEALGRKDNSSKKHPIPRSCTTVITQSKSSTVCNACNSGTHPLFMCKGFLSMRPNDRLKFVLKQKLCVNCMKGGHIAAKCVSRSCAKCNKKHNTLLHLLDGTLKTSSGAPELATTTVSTGTSATVLSTSVMKRGYVVLGTVKLKVAAADGTLIPCRAVLDSGSQINLITENFAKRLQLRFNLAFISVEGIGQRKNGCKGYIRTTIKSSDEEYRTDIEAFTIPKIITQQPSQRLDISSWEIPSAINLADPEFHNPGEIDLLIGAEFYHELLTDGRMQISESLPILQNTVFGWMCCGRINDISQGMLTCGICSEDDEALDSILTKFWQLDNVNHTGDSLTEAEKKSETFYNQTTTRNFDGRFVVRLPFNSDKTCLGESLQMTKNRFYSLEQRLTKQPKLKEMYVEFMREYERLGHMEKMDQENLVKPYYTIPHHCVMKPDSTTTKLRVVFDASARTSSGLSLNDITYKGPVVQSELATILLRFRIHRFVFTTDIEKMYRQIFIHPDDQRFQIIVWRENPNERLQFYRLTTVTYGTRPAPYLSTKCLQRLASDNKDVMPLGAAALDKDFYVDDGLSGSDSLIEALETKKQLITLLSSAGFKARKWCANATQLLEGIPAKDQEVDLNFEDESSQRAIKTLGLSWLPKSDELCIRTKHEFNDSITKRTVTSELARIYDPLGLVAPVIVTAKIFIQRLWQLKVDWDENIPKTQQREWSKFRQELVMLNDLRIPRHIFNHKLAKNFQLHVFTDASERAYGAAVYVRAENKDGTISVQLLCSKSRVAPLKTQTIPRLELCAALLGAELITKVKQDLNYHHVRLHLWTDSEIVLHWINSEPASFQTFVSHRIAKIQELTTSEQWRHVGTKDNPADILSRGISPAEIKQCTIWLFGPLFLHGKETCWPGQFRQELSVCDNLEKRKCTAGVATTIKDDLIKMIYTINHHGSFKYLQRTVAYILRFTSNVRQVNKTKEKTLSITELNNAMVIIIRAIQASDFAEEIQQLIKIKKLKPNCSLASLSPFIDSHGIMRVGGRLQEANLPFDARHPILLPYNDPIVKMIMRQLHEANLHCGPQALLAQTRQRFWPIKGKIMARSIIQHCVRCTRTQPKMFQQIMGSLPQDRVQLERPFF